MVRYIMITGIIAAIVSIVAEIICQEHKSRMFWIGSSAFYFIFCAVTFPLLWRDSVITDIPKQILVFVVMSIIVFVVSLLCGSILTGLLVHRGPEDEGEEEGKKEVGGDGAKENAV